MIKKIMFIITVVVLMFVFCSNTKAENKLKINNRIINIDLAITPEKRQRGLMYIKELADDYGMLFLYDNEKFITMWMKNTYVPLDMIFIDKTGTVVQIEKNTTPLSRKNIYSKKPVKAVLEIKAGLSDKYSIEIGSEVELIKD